MSLSEGNDYQLGRTKVFIRPPEVVYTLEETRERRVNELVVMIQRKYRAWAEKKFIYKVRGLSKAIYNGQKERRKNSGQVNPGDNLRLGGKTSIKKMLME